MKRLAIVRHGAAAPPFREGEAVISSDELRAWARSGRLLAHLGRYDAVRLVTDRVGALGRPLPIVLAARLLARGSCEAVDAAGGTRPLSWRLVGRWTARLAAEPFLRGRLLARAAREVASLEAEPAPRAGGALDRTRPPLFLRADLAFGVKAGGSVGHTAGILNHLGECAAAPIALTSDRVPGLRADVEAHLLDPDDAFWNFRELPALVMNDVVRARAAAVAAHRPPAFVYQRYALHLYAAVDLARRWRVPLVTEYNGSEVWVARHWGQPLRYERLAARIERLNLQAADLVSVVSRALADEVCGNGVDPARVLVNPNGVDPSRYHPDVDGRPVRARYGLEGYTVIGFIGTFGPWHGAEVLAESFVRLLASDPMRRERLRLLWIGDGPALARVRRIVEAGGAAGGCVFTGLVPQDDGPAYLAACDLYASPHVPNPDGTPFFGSPTKLFEYMAMGRGIAASALDQIGEVLEDGRTALLVPPADATALARALARLADDPALRARLGAEARRVALARYTWHAHVGRLVDALEAVLRAQPSCAAGRAR